MKPIPNDFVLRPRFQLDVLGAKEELLNNFEKGAVAPFTIKRLDEHIFIKFNHENNRFWSPQLHLEIDVIDEHHSRIYGVFGPNPSLWTFFMFLHFGVATVFIILGIWGYSSASLKKPYGLQVGAMVFMVVLWLVLYLFGRAGKHKGKPQMQDLYRFMMAFLTKPK